MAPTFSRSAVLAVKLVLLAMVLAAVGGVVLAR